MKNKSALNWLVPLIAVLAASAAGTGLFSTNGDGPFPFTTLRHETVQIYGRGLYQNDTPLTAIGYRVSDAFILLVGIPLLLIAFWMYRRGLMRGKILLTGTLIFFLYNYGSLAVGAAYNNLFLAYIVLTMTTLFGALGLLMSFDLQTFPRLFSNRVPQRGISIFFIISGIALFCIWLFMSILPALLAGTVPAELASYSTVITFALDMGIIAPALVITGRLLLRREPLGYMLMSVMLVFIDVLGCALLAMGIAQEIAGLMNIGQFIGFVVSFAILTLFSLRFTIVLFRNIADMSPMEIAIPKLKRKEV
ncbi:MAG TPA: hypothetical protein VK206_06180 [Anaerolineales bacterium]|nr:hypothetical protein [Anaerolineales bacterium]